MTRKKKISDEQLIAAIKANPNGSLSAIAKSAGLAPGGYTTTRIQKLRSTVNAKTVTADNVLAFSEIRENDRLMRAGKRLVVITTDPSYIRVRRMDGSTESISRSEFSKHATEYAKVSQDSPQGGPVTTYYIPPGTEPGDIKVNGQPIKNLPDEDKEKIVTHFVGGGMLDIPQPGESKPMFEDIDYTDPAWGVTEEWPRCTGCGRKLTDEEIEYYEVRCESCESRTVDELSGRPVMRVYLNRINQLLDIMEPECRENPVMKRNVITVANGILERGFAEEVGGAK